MYRGYWMVWHKIEDSGLEEDPYAYVMLMHLTRRARRSPCKQITGGRVLHLERGQIVVGRYALAGRLKWSESKVRRALDILEETGAISRQKIASVCTVVSVTNYDTYQLRPGESYQHFRQRNSQHFDQQDNQHSDQMATKEQPEGNQRASTVLSGDLGIPVSGKEEEEKETLALALPDPLNEIAREAVELINELKGSRYDWNTKQTLKDLRVILRSKIDGVPVSREMILAVIADRWRRWREEERSREWVRPSTLFRLSKFRQYAAELPAVGHEPRKEMWVPEEYRGRELPEQVVAGPLKPRRYVDDENPGRNRTAGSGGGLRRIGAPPEED